MPVHNRRKCPGNFTRYINASVPMVLVMLMHQLGDSNVDDKKRPHSN